MPKAFRTSLASAGDASVTTRPFSTSYEFAPTFMVIEDGMAYGERAGALPFVFSAFRVFAGDLADAAAASAATRRRAARSAPAERRRSPRAVSYREMTRTGSATSASRTSRRRSGSVRFLRLAAEPTASSRAGAEPTALRSDFVPTLFRLCSRESEQSADEGDDADAAAGGAGPPAARAPAA